MFGSRRRRAASNPALNGMTANPAATTAATSAFLKNRASNVSLSSAAAAAALKARPMTPTSVADVQTKRTLKRTGSTSSMGSSLNGSQRSGTPQMERRLSSGSMSERTFRDPSPGRPVPSAVDAPPVPTIPHNMQGGAHRRTASMEPPPARITSPVPRLPNGRGTSLQPDMSRRAGQRSSVSELTSVERSRGSVNFSYPTNSRPNSPMSTKRLTSPSSRQNPRITAPNNQSLIYDPNTRSFLPAVEVHAIQQKIYDAANKPVKKKKRDPPGSNSGSHFSDGTVGGRPKGTAVAEIEARTYHAPQRPVEEPVKEVEREPVPIAVPIAKPVSESLVNPVLAPQTAAPILKKKRKKVVTREPDSDQGSYVPNSSDNDSDTVLLPPRRGQGLGKKPSIVREDREREEEEDDTPKREKPDVPISRTSPVERNVSPSPLPRSKAGRGHGKEIIAATPSLSQEMQNSNDQPTSPSMQDIEPVAETIEPVSNGSIRGTRVSSLSPGRNAHFAATPDNLMVKHQPPPRSISPRKSALKHSNSRTSSPMPGSEASNSPGAPEEQVLPRKKSVRVSFDETNVSVGEAAPVLPTDSPIAASPQSGKRPWYSIGRGKKKEFSTTDDEEDEIMKPRPALPFFGSVRERKNRDVEERALVKPAEPVDNKLRSPLSITHTEDESPSGQSNDHLVGALFAQDSTTKNAANISKSREPLPPQVTSVEGTGYHSDSDSVTSETDINTPPTVITEPETKEPLKPIQTQVSSVLAPIPVISTPVPIIVESDDTPTPTQATTGRAIPEIAISQPTPTPEENEKKTGWLDIPGSWDTSESESNETPRLSLDEPVAPTPAAAGISEPIPDLQVHGSPKVEVEHIYSTPVIMEETESEADVFSDAAEELTESEDEKGFQSLNAVVESPITRPTSIIPDPPANPTSKLVKKPAYEKSGLSEEISKVHGQGWDKAQEYWSGLSADKKRQMELDATRATEEDSNTEMEVKPLPKPKRKKKVVKPAVQGPVTTNDRTYMIQPGSKAAPDSFTPLRTSMRVAPPAPLPEVSIKKSMRSPGQGSMRDSMRGSQIEPRGSMQKKTRPVSLPVESRSTPVVNHSRNLSSTATSTAFSKPQTSAHVLHRKKSSDSESSFKRSRPSKDRNMMQTMRVNNNSPQQEKSNSFSMRSMSPVGSINRRPFGASSTQQNDIQPQMRMSMRGSSGAAPTMRGPASRPKSPSSSLKMPGFGRSKPGKAVKSTKSLSSRFADSSDEEDERPAFRSRFLDSSDESDNESVQKSSSLGRTMRSTPVALTPPVPSVAPNLRAIPKKIGVEDGDSSELPDSDDEKPSSPSTKLSKRRQANGTTTPNGNTQGIPDSLRRSGSGRGNLTTISAPPVSRPPQKRRGSIMSILRRKKDDTSKVRKLDAESAARRDTPLERSKTDLAALRTTPGSPKLQKRNPLSRENSMVPFSPIVSAKSVVDDGAARPTSADTEGANAGDVLIGDEKPELVSRRFTTDGPVNGSAAFGVGAEGIGGKKKKKFASLRRMFRLDD